MPSPIPTPTAIPEPVPLSWLLPFTVADSYDPTTKSQGDISFRGFWVVIPFGGALGAGTSRHWREPADSSPGNPDIWFEVVPGTILRASAAGRVTIGENDSIFPNTKDWEIHIALGDGPYWIEYDHVVDLLVSDGEFVERGQPLARAAPASIRHGGEEGDKPVDEFEWGLRLGGPTAIAVCPFPFLTVDEQVRLESVLETMDSRGFYVGDNVCLTDEVSG